MPSPRIHALILDYGNVLTHPQRQDCVFRMAARLDVPRELFATTYRAERVPYDGGEDPERYWLRVLTRMGKEKLFSSALLAALIEEDSASWQDYREEVWQLAARFRAGGGRTALLSNNVRPLMRTLRAERRLDVFDVVAASCDLGACKPDPSIFLACLEALGVAPECALFVDDVEENVTTARALGLATVHFDGPGAVTDLAGRLARL